MCRLQVRVVEVDDEKLAAPWAAGLAEDGKRVLFVRQSATPTQVAEGYAMALRECAIRKSLDDLEVRLLPAF